MTSNKPWEDPADFDQVAARSENWTEMASAYGKRGFSVSRDTMRRTGEKHGIFPKSLKKDSSRAAQIKVKQLSKELKDQQKQYEQTIKQLQNQPREKDPEEVIALKKRIATLEANLKTARETEKHLIKSDNLIEEVKELFVPILEAYKVPKWTAPDPLPVACGSPISAVLAFADGHWGKEVDPVMVNGLNRYSPVICALRTEKVVERFLRICRTYAHEHTIEELVLLELGDPIENTHGLHPDDATSKQRAGKQVLDHALVKSQAVADLAPYFPTIRVVCVGADNHGRGTRKSPMGKPAIEQSWTAQYHEHLATLCMNLDNVEFQHSPSYQAFVSVQGKTLAVCHGHHVGGGGGITGIPTGIRKTHDASVTTSLDLLKRMDFSTFTDPEDFISAISSVVDFSVVAHFHSFNKVDNARMTSSLVGTDEYVLNALKKKSVAAQLSFFMHPTRGIIGDHDIYVQDVMDEGPTPRYQWGALEDGTTAATIMKNWQEKVA